TAPQSHSGAGARVISAAAINAETDAQTRPSASVRVRRTREVKKKVIASAPQGAGVLPITYAAAAAASTAKSRECVPLRCPPKMSEKTREIAPVTGPSERETLALG